MAKDDTGGKLTASAGKAPDAGTAAAPVAAAARPKAKRRAAEITPPSPNPMTNLLIADVALRGGARVVRLMVERGLLRTKYPQDTAKSLVKGRSLTNTLIGAAAARLATRSVPGALVVGGGLLAKTLYERRKGAKAQTDGNKKLAKRVAKGSES